MIRGNSTWRTKIVLSWDPSVFGNLEPGRDVEVVANFRNAGSDETLTSRVMRVRLHEPGGRDREAFESLRKAGGPPYLGYWLFVKGSVGQSQLRSLDRCSREYADTVYGAYASFARGQMEFFNGNYEGAIDRFKRLAENNRPPGMVEDAWFLLAESYRSLPRPDYVAAAGALREILTRYPDTPAADDARELVRDVSYRAMVAADRRLNADITCDFIGIPRDRFGLITFEEAFQQVSIVGGVPLRVAPELRANRFSSEPFTGTLRYFMEMFHDPGWWVWVKDGDGYRLVSAPEEPKKEKP